MVCCRICNRQYTRLMPMHLKKHGLTPTTYVQKFPEEAENFRLTLEHKQKISKSQRGNTNGKSNKGRKMSPDWQVAVVKNLRRDGSAWLGRKHTGLAKSKMSAAKTGVPGHRRGKKHSIESRKRMSESQVASQKRRQPDTSGKLKEAWSEGKYDKRRRLWKSRWEDSVAKIMTDAGIVYRRQFRIKGSRHPFDFFIPSLNLIIELDGCFWHGCEVCTTKTMRSRYPHMKRARRNDPIITRFAESKGYRVLRITEHDFHADAFTERLK